MPQGDIFKTEAGDSLTFVEAFPAIQAVDVEILEEGRNNEGLGTRRFKTATLREYVNCSNDRCSGRGLSLGALLRDMCDQRLTHLRVQRPCEGCQGLPGGSCPNRFTVDITIQFK